MQVQVARTLKASQKDPLSSINLNATAPVMRPPSNSTAKSSVNKPYLSFETTPVNSNYNYNNNNNNHSSNTNSNSNRADSKRSNNHNNNSYPSARAQTAGGYLNTPQNQPSAGISDDYDNQSVRSYATLQSQDQLDTESVGYTSYNDDNASVGNDSLIYDEEVGSED